MMNLFFPRVPRVTRAHYWKAIIGYFAVSLLVALVCWVISRFIPNESAEPGTYSVNGAASIPFIVVILGFVVFQFVSSIKIARRRFHDRDKSGWWILIGLIPFVGQIWYMVELGFLAGTPGPNRYGPAPRRDGRDAPQVGFSTAV